MTTTIADLALALLLLAPADDPEHTDVIAQLEAAIDNYAQEDRHTSIIRLEELIERVTRFPGYALDTHEVLEATLRARIALVRLYLAERDEDSAAMIMDEAIRMARDQELPIREYGPQVFQLYQERSEVIKKSGLGTIEINCAPEPGCDVVISGRLLPSGETSEQLPPGHYRVWVREADKDGPWHSYKVELSPANRTQTIEHRPPADEPDENGSDDDEVSVPQVPQVPGTTKGVSSSRTTTDRPRKNDRMLHRAAEITGSAVGVGLVVAGAVLLSFDGKCDGSGDRPTPETTPEDCGNIYETTPASAAMMGVGGGLLVVSGVMLTIDEVQLGTTKGRQVMLGVRLHF